MTYYKRESTTANSYVSLVYPGHDHVTGRSVVAFMGVNPLSSGVELTVAFSEHWPGGTYKFDLETNDYATKTITMQKYTIGNSYSAQMTYGMGARFLGYAND